MFPAKLLPSTLPDHLRDMLYVMRLALDDTRVVGYAHPDNPEQPAKEYRALQRCVQEGYLVWVDCVEHSFFRYERNGRMVKAMRPFLSLYKVTSKGEVFLQLNKDVVIVVKY